LVSVQPFTVNNVNLPTNVIVTPPVRILQGQFVAIANPAGAVLPLPNGVANANFNILISTTAPSAAVGSTVTMTQNAAMAPSWRVSNLATLVATSVAAGQSSAAGVPPPVVATGSASASASASVAAKVVAVAAAPATTALSAGIIVGIVIGVLVFVALVATIIVFVVWRRARSEPDRVPTPDQTDSMSMSSPPVHMTQRSMTGDSRKMNPNSSRDTAPAVWPPQESGVFDNSGSFQKRPNPAYQVNTTDTYLQRKTIAATTGEIPLCSRCDEREATVDCSDCRSFFCHQCMLELHYSAESKWSGHSIQPFRLYN